jgi:PKD repeat protein
MLSANAVTRLVGTALLVAALVAPAAQQARINGALAPNSTAATGPIACTGTPFGNAVPVFHDYEYMLLLWNGTSGVIDEYRPWNPQATMPVETAPLTRVSRSNLGTARPLRKALKVDFNGDGRDETIEVHAGGSDVQLAVWERTDGPPAGASSISTWTYTEPVLPDTITIVAGDFDGSKTRKRAIAVSWKIASGANAGKVRVVVLQGNGIAHFSQTSGNTAGFFLSTNAGLQFPQLVAGDFLAQGRDQILLAAYDPAMGKVSLDLLEFDNGSHPATITTALPSLFNSMRGANFSTRMGGLNDGITDRRTWFQVDNPEQEADAEGVTYFIMQAAGGIPIIEDFAANGGDVADTAAEEIIYTTMFYDTAQAKHVLGQRLLHFQTTRNGSNVITAIGLAPPPTLPIGADWDSSTVLGIYPDPPPKFAATVAEVDAIEKEEIVTAIAGHDGLHGATAGPMTWAARKVYVRNAADFTWRNIEKDDSNKPVVEFTDSSHGQITSWEWDFGDGSGVGTDQNPRHSYASNNTYTVTLTTTDVHGATSGASQQVTVTGNFDASAHYTNNLPPGWTYVIDPDTSLFHGDSGGTTYSTIAGNTTIVKVGVGDMNKDGLPEVVVAVNSNGSGVDSHVFTRQANGSFAGSTLSNPADTGITTMDIAFSDFDGDGLTAVISNVFGDCANVNDTAIFALSWMPPYFSGPQANSARFATYGKSSSTSSSTEDHSESFFSNSLSLSVGFEAEVSIPIAAIKVEEISAKVTVGAEYQFANGETHGDENTYSINEGFSVGNDNLGTDEEAVVVYQTANSNCYTYIMSTADKGALPKSKLRACNPTAGVPSMSALGAKYWNLSGTVQEPYHWVPAQRDWASEALWHTVKYGSDPATPVSFVAGHGPEKAVDGRFAQLKHGAGSAEDVDAADVVSASAVNLPYLEVDLGFVREIRGVRVFPSANACVPPTDPAPVNYDCLSSAAPLDFGDAVLDLAGFRLYASATPFVGYAPPTDDDFTNVVLDGISTFVQSGDGEGVYRAWNVWTSDDGGNPVRARYLRLQKPASGKISIAEIQVFGDTHTEPQYFPEGVCDPTVGDGLFKARVYDFVDRQYRTIQVRGDMVWNGGVDDAGTNTGVPSCTNDAAVRQGPIWANTFVTTGGTAMDWNLSSDNTHTDGTSHTEEWSGRVGAEFEAKTGGDVLAVVGAAYEFVGGATTEHQSGRSVSAGFELGGGVGGFPDIAPKAYPCNYFPRPYNFTAKDYSDTGYLHNYNVTDYVVRQIPNSALVNVWQRQNVSSLCTDFARDEAIFHDHFGNNDGNVLGF